MNIGIRQGAVGHDADLQGIHEHQHAAHARLKGQSNITVSVIGSEIVHADGAAADFYGVTIINEGLRQRDVGITAPFD